MASILAAPNLSLTVGTADVLDVREFVVEEGISRPFDVRLLAVSHSPDVDFEGAIGGAARFEIRHAASLTGDTRYWNGVCAAIQQVAVEDDGLSTYSIHIVPSLWLLGHRRTYRIFQDKSELDIVLEVLSGWGIQPKLRVDAGSFPKRRYRTQYAETDFAFISRMLEDIGVSYTFEQEEGDTNLTLVEAPNRGGASRTLPFVAVPNERLQQEYVTQVMTTRQVRPGRYTQSDVDYRKPLDYPLAASAALGGSAEQSLEKYHHNYGSFLWKGGNGDTPFADDRGPARTNEGQGATQVKKRLEAQRGDARLCTFRTTAYDLLPGQVLSVVNHPRAELGAPMLVVHGRLTGTATGEWEHSVEARYADLDFRPPMSTPKPRTNGVESATVTGPGGEEIHTDEFGRVRLHFHWDREGKSDETSSCWVPVSQPWAGSGMGAISLPRVGQEVIVDFLGADPDRPVIMGSVFTTTMPPPYKLPQFKMVSGMRSETYPRPRSIGGGARMGGGPATATPTATPTAIGAKARALPARPAGGGVPLLSRRGGGDGTVPDAGGQSGGIMPGPFGGPEMSDMSQLVSSVTGNKALGPDEQDVSRNTNAIVSNDTAGAEQLYLQGQYDLHLVSKHDMTGSVGANRVFTVHANDTEKVLGYQDIGVELNRTVDVKGEQKHTVTKDILIYGQMNHTLRAKNSIASIAEEGGNMMSAKLANVFTVGEQSTIIQLPNAIVIEAPKVFINPGKEFTQTLVQGGSLDDANAAQKAADDQRAAEAAEAARQAAIAKATGDLTQRLRDLQKPDALPWAYQQERDSYATRADALRQPGIEDNALVQHEMEQYGLTDPNDYATAYDNALNAPPEYLP